MKKQNKTCEGRSKTNKTANVLPLMSFPEMHPGEGLWASVWAAWAPANRKGVCIFLPWREGQEIAGSLIEVGGARF